MTELQFSKWFSENLKQYWESADKHRRGISDMAWAEQQPKGPPKYRLGDVVKFKVGGVGIITDVSKPHNGWPSSYAVKPIKGRKFHPKNKSAWHYEGDISKLVGRTRILKV